MYDRPSGSNNVILVEDEKRGERKKERKGEIKREEREERIGRVQSLVNLSLH